MAGTSISSQLQAIKTVLNASTDPEPGKRRPLTRPSILFDAKAAADIDLDTILDIALSGLEFLITMEERFRNYKNDLFSYQSKELDRELVGQEENNRINASISSYLRLLSGYLESHSALKTLEYLIRRYKVHVYNAEDLILCALPYHDTHVFVQIVQLINPGNSRWRFLDGVKASGARLPREVIVQQCIRDVGVLEAICNYATPVKKIQPSKHVVGFCTAVIFEFLGGVNVDSDTVKRILPYVSSGLQAGARGLNQKAGALMIVSLLAQKAALAPSVVKSLLHLVADVARADAKERSDLQWLRMSFMTLITIVQLQSVELIPKKTMDVLSEIRDISWILLGLTEDFKIDKFLAVFLDSLVEYSAVDDLCHRSLLSIIETVPLKAYVDRMVSRLLVMRMKLSQAKNNLASSESGSHGKQILVSICEKYPNESRGAFYCFLKDAKIQSKKVSSSYDLLCTILDEHLKSSEEIPDPKIFFALEHSEAEIRKSAVLSLDVVNILKEKAVGSKKFDAIQDALIRRLYDDDLNVVLAVLNLKDLSEVLSSPLLIEALQHVLHRCLKSLLSSPSANTSVPGNAALSCLQQLVTNFKDQEHYAMTLATAIFPLLLIRHKTWRLNLKALELAKELKWPFYENLVFPGSEKKLEPGRISSINFDNINKLAETFSLSPDEYMTWLVKCYNSHELSKTLFFLVLSQSLKMLKMDAGQFSAFFDSCFPIVKNEWEVLESPAISAVQSKKRILDGDCKGILEDLTDADISDLNAEILACLFLRLSEAFVARAPEDVSLDMKGKWASMLEDLFLFFACHSADAFKKHLEYLLTPFKISLTKIILKLFTEEGVPSAAQIESLHSFSHICSQFDESSALQLLADFSYILVPLSSDNQNVRVAAMSCIEELAALWSRISRTGNDGVRLHFLGELLCLIMQQKKMILSDKNLLASLLTSLLGSSSDSLLVQHAIGERFNESTKDDILVFMLEHTLRLPAHAKLKVLSLVKGVGIKLLSISGVRSLLNDLLESRHRYYLGDGKLYHKLSKSEVDILCLLLESCARATSSREAHDVGDFILKALQVNGAEDPAVLEPCKVVLRNISSSLYGDMKIETQELIFRNLLVLFRSAHVDIQNSARDTLLRINLNFSIVGRVLDSILDQNSCPVPSAHGKKKKKSVKSQDLHQCSDATWKRGNILSLLSSFLDVLLMKKDIDNRTSLVGPLFKLLHLILANDGWMLKGAADQDKAHLASSGSPPTVSDATGYIQQTLLLALEDICASFGNDGPQKDNIHNIDLQQLVSCARSSSDPVTRNHAFALITTLVNVIPDQVLGQMLDILTAIGESTVTQWDSYSQRVFEGLISAIIPCWLSRTNNPDELLQIFVDVLPQVAGHRRLSIIAYILRTLGEAESLGSLLFLLFRSLISRKSSLGLLVHEQSLEHWTFIITKQWEYEFAVQLCEQYSCTIWLPSLILALQKIGSNTLSEDTFMQILVAMQFVADKLRDPEISYKLELEEDLDHIQSMVGELMEQGVCHLELADLKKKHIDVPVVIKSELKEYIRSVLKTLTKGLLPSSYFKIIIKLIDHVDRNVRKKALGLLCETVKDLGTSAKVEKKGFMSSVRSLWLDLNETSRESFEDLCLKILTLLDASDDVSSTSLKLAAVSALEILASRFSSNDRVFSTCLGSVCRRICSDNSALSIHCLRATGALVNALGPRALPELPSVMEGVLRKSRDISSVAAETESIVNGATGSSNSVDSLFMSILLTLEAVVNQLSGFLNPYLGDILRLVVLNPLSFSPSEIKLKLKADVVRKLVTEKIPVRLLLPPVMSMYSDAIKSGESSLSIVFEMLGSLVSSMDRSSVGVYHARIFDLCLLALDLRHQNPASIQNIDVVEQNVINAVVTLTMKLTETMFRPLFIKTMEWSGLNVESDADTPGKANSRAISFYSLVNKLAESHRSLFVPYFKYLVDGCVRGLVDAEDTKTGLTQKKKKAKLSNSTKNGDVSLSLQVWHLRALILSSLHKSFLYDTGSSKFLDSSNFQILLKPIVSQLVVDPPQSIENHPNVPSVKEVDDLLVACVGQMAVTAASDLLWKPLNHEVLMHTRSEKIRPRMLGLRIVKHLLENLKEEYLVLLPETIPFLGELLEDSELSVKSLAQDIIKDMETLSGESLRQYL
ncbi:hypothetical protein CDL12_15648 [Handroanthus impetiginosus]|uniref:BP28 C-terminal domain-containing protein n=1 Tax=Handroanthus impetiginosus TaxID=429701 RepID=A0A2G9H2J2_9LAMI|nr:hypothetical protein CDL12_15648 [Handroanthus impetiginosus]